MATVKMIKKDGVIPISLGAGFFQKLQSVLFYLTEERTDEELIFFKSLVEKQEELPEPWMEHLYTMVLLIKELENSAERNNMIVENHVDDINQPES